MLISHIANTNIFLVSHACLIPGMMNAHRYAEVELPISLETLQSVEWAAFVGSKLERKPVPYSSPHNRYEATRTGLPSPGNEVARLPKGDMGRKRPGC